MLPCSYNNQVNKLLGIQDLLGEVLNADYPKQGFKFDLSNIPQFAVHQ
jgi:hypothetical protein